VTLLSRGKRDGGLRLGKKGGGYRRLGKDEGFRGKEAGMQRERGMGV
jgi:hypothetical protein